VGCSAGKKGKGEVRRPNRGKEKGECFAPGEGNPQEKVGRGLRPIKDGIKISRKGKCPRNRKIRLKIGIAKAFGG